MKKGLIILTAAMALPGCGLHPLYTGGSSGPVAQSLSGVSVTPIEGKAGYLMRNALNDRLGTSGQVKYRLDVKLDDRIQGFGVRRDDAITRERRSLRARFQLVDASRGTVLLDATAGSDAGIDAVSSEYATIAGENTALENLSQTVADQIVARIALYVQRSGRTMKVKEAQISRALDNPDGMVRLYLLYGPDDAGSRALAARLDRAMGTDAERIDIDGVTMKDDPARLADEAASISLFGSKRFIRAVGGDESTAAVESLLQSSRTGDPVVFIAGALKPTSSLLKLALNDQLALCCASYKPEGSTADELAVMVGRGLGIRITGVAARQLANDCLNDRAIMERELEKIALFLDAAPDRPRDADVDVLDAIGAGLGEANISLLVDTILTGQLSNLAAELTILAESRLGVIPIVRGLSRRLVLLTRLKGEVDAGKSVGSVMATVGKILFYKEKNAISAQLSRWDTKRLRTATERIFMVEQAVKKSRSAGEVLAFEELVAIGRVAERLR